MACLIAVRRAVGRAGASLFPYLDEAWLRQELEEHRTYEAVARRYGFKAHELGALGRDMGIDAKNEYWGARRARSDSPYLDEGWLRAELEMHRTYSALARVHGFERYPVAAAGRSFGIDVWTEYGATARRYPYRPYENEGWLRRELEKHRTYSALARAHGFSRKEVAGCGRSFGIDLEREYPQGNEWDHQLLRAVVLWEFDRTGPTREELAEQFKAPLGVVRRFLLGRKRRPHWTKEWLEVRLNALGSAKRLAKVEGVSPATVYRECNRLGIKEWEVRDRSQPKWYVRERWLRQQLELYGSYAAVARRCDVPEHVLARRGREFGIAVREEYDRRPYESERWLRKQLEKHRSYMAVAEAHGFSHAAVADAGRSMGIDVFLEYPMRRRKKPTRKLPPRPAAPRQPYHDEAWLRSELEVLTTYQLVGETHGFDPQVLSTVGRSMGIDSEREYGRRRPDRELPEFVTPDWLKGALEEHGTLLAVARERRVPIDLLASAAWAFGVSAEPGCKLPPRTLGPVERVRIIQEFERGGLKRDDVARRLGVPVWMVRKALVGRRRPPPGEEERALREFQQALVQKILLDNEERLRAELAICGTVTGVAWRYGVKVSQVVAALSKFGIDVQAEYWAGREA